MPADRGSFLSRAPAAGLAIPLIVAATVWLANMHRVPWEDAVPTIAALLVLAIALTAAFRLALGDWVRAGLAAGLASAYLLYAPTAAAMIGTSFWVQVSVLVGAAALAIAVGLRIPRDRAPLLDTNRKLNLILIPVVIGMGGVVLAKQVGLERIRPGLEETFGGFQGRAGPDAPDVWHLLFDRYGSSETLARVYGYDNRPFLEELRKRGFAIDDAAFSNYQRTAHSVSSTLNGAYLDPLAARMAGHERDWVPLYRAMTSNRALTFFNDQGYDTRFAGSWWNPTRRSPLADGNINYRTMPELARSVLDQSVIGFVLRGAGLPYGDSRGDQCRRIRFKFEALRARVADQGRKYTFAHFLVPHPPFVIGADGACRSLREVEKSSRAYNYTQQINYVNAEILKLVDAIAAGPRPAVIILHSDEGPWPEPHVGDERFIGHDPVKVDWAALTPDQLREKMGILMAVRYADGRARPAPRSPVAIYPTLLKAHFGGSGAIPETRHLIFTSDDALFSFADVGASLKRAENHGPR